MRFELHQKSKGSTLSTLNRPHSERRCLSAWRRGQRRGYRAPPLARPLTRRTAFFAAAPRVRGRARGVRGVAPAIAVIESAFFFSALEVLSRRGILRGRRTATPRACRARMRACRACRRACGAAAGRAARLLPTRTARRAAVGMCDGGGDGCGGSSGSGCVGTGSGGGASSSAVYPARLATHPSAAEYALPARTEHVKAPFGGRASAAAAAALGDVPERCGPAERAARSSLPAPAAACV